MSEFGPVDILEWLGSLPRTASGDQRHHEAILASLLGYLLFRERNDWRYEKASLICLQSAIEGRLKEFGDQAVHLVLTKRRVPSAFEASRKSVWRQVRTALFAMPVSRR